MIRDIVRGPNGEKVGYWRKVKAKPVRKEMGSNTKVRWLISEEDGAGKYVMRLFEMKPGGHINLHKHPWEHEIFVIDGEGEILIGNEVYRVSKGNFIFIPPNIVHAYRNTSKTKTFRFLCIIPTRPK